MTTQTPSFDKDMKQAIKKNLSRYPDYAMHFYYTEWETSFLRFYHSQTNYNIHKQDISLRGIIEKDNKKMEFSLSHPDESALQKAVSDTVQALHQLPPDNDWHSFEDDTQVFEYSDYPDSVAAVSLDRKIAILDRLARMAEPYDFEIYGIFICSKVQTRIINTQGLDKLTYQSPVMLEVKAVSRKNMVTVIDAFGGDSLEGFDLEAFSSRFEKKIKHATLDVVDVEAGEYDVILAPYAMQEFMSYLGYSFYDSTLDQGMSFVQDKQGRKIFPASISLSSRPHHPRLINVPYNGDGHYAPDLDLIRDGVFKEFVVDHYYSHKLKLKKNGSVGNQALVMDSGNSSLEDMFKSIKKGLYISNLHYMNFINQKETSVTGITRDGTFLIEDGRITKVVNNLRYTMKITDILNHTALIENKQYVVPQSSNYNRFTLMSGLMPHVLTRGFKISSSTHTI